MTKSQIKSFRMSGMPANFPPYNAKYLELLDKMTMCDIKTTHGMKRTSQVMHRLARQLGAQ